MPIRQLPLLVSDKPGTVLSYHTLATMAHGMCVEKALKGPTARAIVYESNLGVCANTKCILSASTEPFEHRAEVSKETPRDVPGQEGGRRADASSIRTPCLLQMCVWYTGTPCCMAFSVLGTTGERCAPTLLLSTNLAHISPMGPSLWAKIVLLELLFNIVLYPTPHRVHRAVVLTALIYIAT